VEKSVCFVPKIPPKPSLPRKNFKKLDIGNQRDSEKKRKKTKKNFVSLRKGCIFAVPFEREKASGGDGASSLKANRNRR